LAKSSKLAALAKPPRVRLQSKGKEGLEEDRKTRAFCLTPKADGWGFEEKHAKHNLQVNP